MRATTRRGFVLSAATAALGLDGRAAIGARARRQRTPDPAPGYFRFQVGAAECTALYDGIWEKRHDGTDFSNANTAEVKRALADARLPTAFISFPITVLVIRLNGKLVLCDAGGGGQVHALHPRSVFVSGKMLRNMQAASIDPEDIETILVSHFHPDQIFGLMEKNSNAPAFPMAEIIVPAAEYKFWTDPATIARLPAGHNRSVARRIQAAMPGWKNVLPVDGEDEVVPGIRFVSAPGHTPGHTAFHVASGEAQLMVSNDTACVPALVAAHPGWHGAFDLDASLAEATRRKLLDRVIADKMMICGTHFPWPGVGRIARDGVGYAFERLPTR
jgi:glyoxylase-like metal-dependent hydrolase (beta-lactamase superfamily II)